MRFEREINIYGDEVILKRFTANETSISVIQGEISAIISESEMIELIDSSVTMYSKLASAIMDIDSLTINFSDLTTKYNTVSGQYTALDSKVAKYQASVDGLSANVSQISQNLTNNYSTTTAMNSAINLAVDQFSVSVSQTYATNAGVNEKLSDYSTTIEMQAAIKLGVQQISLAVENGEYSSKITLLANGTEIHSETISMQGLVKFTDLSNAGSTTINGSNINGGTITLGGGGNSDGSISIRNSNNLEIATFDNTGINIKTGGSIRAGYQSQYNGMIYTDLFGNGIRMYFNDEHVFDIMCTSVSSGGNAIGINFYRDAVDYMSFGDFNAAGSGTQKLRYQNGKFDVWADVEFHGKVIQ